MMKKAFVVVISGVVLSALVFWFSGCKSDQLGETTAEGNRRHQRNLRLDRQEMTEDIDTALLLDKPSKLTDKRIP